MEKQTFIKTIEFIYEQRKKDDMLCDAIMNICNQSSISTFYSEYENKLVETLQEAMNDKNDIIGFKLYELDGNGVCTSQREKILKDQPYLNSWEEVYDYLTKGDTNV